MHAAETVEGNVGLYGYVGALAGCQNLIHAVDYECGMGSFCGMKVRFKSEVQADGTRPEPDAVSLSHSGRLFDFYESEDAGIKGSSAIFAADGNADLYVLDAEDGHFFSLRCKTLG